MASAAAGETPPVKPGWNGGAASRGAVILWLLGRSLAEVAGCRRERSWQLSLLFRHDLPTVSGREKDGTHGPLEIL